jgi:hypothetical protein
VRFCAIAIVLCSAIAWAAPKGTLQVRVTTHACGTCGMPPGQPKPAPRTNVKVYAKGKLVDEQVSDENGKATFSLPAGKYCVTDGVAPANQCDSVVAGKLADLLVDFTQCPELHCTGREP